MAQGQAEDVDGKSESDVADLGGYSESEDEYERGDVQNGAEKGGSGGAGIEVQEKHCDEEEGVGADIGSDYLEELDESFDGSEYLEELNEDEWSDSEEEEADH